MMRHRPSYYKVGLAITCRKLFARVVAGNRAESRRIEIAAGFPGFTRIAVIAAAARWVIWSVPVYLPSSLLCCTTPYC